MAVEELRILATVERMEAWLHKVLEKMPKFARYPVYTHMKTTMRDMRRLIIECNAAYEKSPYFDKIDVEISLLRSDARVMMEARLVTPGEFKVWCENIDLVGKQLGRWIRAINEARNKRNSSKGTGLKDSPVACPTPAATGTTRPTPASRRST